MKPFSFTVCTNVFLFCSISVMEWGFRFICKLSLEAFYISNSFNIFKASFGTAIFFFPIFEFLRIRFCLHCTKLSDINSKWWLCFSKIPDCFPIYFRKLHGCLLNDKNRTNQSLLGSVVDLCLELPPLTPLKTSFTFHSNFVSL